MTPSDCEQKLDPLKLVREGTSQDTRMPYALDPTYAPINERGVEHSIVFAQRYAALLKYFDTTNTATGDWSGFFAADVSAQLALVAIEDIESYKVLTKSWFDFLNHLENQSNEVKLKDTLGFLYNTIASLRSSSTSW